MTSMDTEEEKVKAMVSPSTNGFGINGIKAVSPVAQKPNAPRPLSSTSPIAKRPRYQFDEFKDNEAEANQGVRLLISSTNSNDDL